ncbi:MAG: hypothetical protein R6U36_05730 [Candidatus Fermentibacteraceae bacterium]
MKRLTLAAPMLAIALALIPGSAGAEEVDPVSWEVLQDRLPEPPSGWNAGEAEGQTLSSSGFTASMAERSYGSSSADGEDVKVTIVDGAYSSATPWSSQFETAFEYSSSEGHVRRTEVEGHPALDIYETPDNYQLLVKVSDRFFVYIESETEEARSLFAGMVDYDSLAGLE